MVLSRFGRSDTFQGCAPRPRPPTATPTAQSAVEISARLRAALARVVVVG